MVSAFCAVLAPPARAQAPDTVFVAGSVSVDVTAGSAAAAQQQAIDQAERLGFQRVARRLTLASERASIGEPQATGIALQRMVLRVDVEEERNSNTRYIARLAVRTNPDVLRSYLRSAGYTVVETRTAPLLVVPGAAGVSEQAATVWREVWEQSGYSGDLVPIAVAPATAPTSPEWGRIDDIARAASAGAALFANLTVSGQTARVTLVETGPNVANRSRGVLEARIGSGDAGLRTALASLAQQANDLVQEEWKASVVAGAGEATRITVSAIYSNRAEWDRIKGGLRGAERLISAISIDAVAREGAVLSFSYVGGLEQLTDELRRNGLTLSNGPFGVELRAGRS
jgi:hypothetical protein